MHIVFFRLWQVPYYWLGIKAYDFVSGRRVLKNSFYISKEQALERFPMLKKDSLKGALIYYDGSFLLNFLPAGFFLKFCPVFVTPGCLFSTFLLSVYYTQKCFICELLEM